MIALDLYEPQVLALVVFASFLGMSALVYIISILTFKEKTYEEAIAEQRAQLSKEQQQQQQQRDQKHKRRQVFTRKKKEKGENNVANQSPPPSPPQPKPVEEVIKPKVEQQVAAAPPPAPQQKAKSPKQGKQQKAAQQQQQQPQQQQPSKAKESAKNAPAPVKEAPAKKAQKETPKEAPVKEAPIQKAAAANTKAAPPPAKTPSPKTTQKSTPKPAPKQKQVEEKVQKKEAVVVAQKAPVSQTAPPPAKKETSVPLKKEASSPAKSKGKGSRSVAASGDKGSGPAGDTAVDTGAMKAKNLTAMLKAASLSNKEVQQLVEVLLNKNGGSAAAASTSENWVKANQRDPMQAMKKQLQEKEQALHNEMLLAQSSSQKVKELRVELNQEKGGRLQIESRYKEKVQNQAREIEAFKVRMQQSHDSHARETQNLQTRIKQMESRTDNTSLEALKQENARLKAEATRNAQHFQNEMQKIKSQASNNESHMRQSEEQRRNLETKRAQLEQQLKMFEAGQAGQRENETALSKRLSEVSEELRKAESRLQTATCDGDKAKEMVVSLSKESETLKSQLQDVYRLDSEKSTQMATMEARVRDAEKQKATLESVVIDSKGKLGDAERLSSQKDKEIKNLKDAKSSLASQLETKTKELSLAMEANKPNGDMAPEGSKEDTITKKDHENIVNEKEKALAALQQQVSASKKELESVKQTVEQQKQRNNKLQEKNWKAMEALAAAEKTSSEKVSKAVTDQKEELNATLFKEQETSRKYLTKIFPDISVKEGLAHKDWMSQFEKNALNYLAVQKASSGLEVTELSSKLSGLEEEKTKLVSQCQHYKSVLSDTEGILNKLQSSVESEEKKWQDKLSIKDTALAQAKRELASVQEQQKDVEGLRKASAEKEALAAELEKAKTSISQMEKERSASSAEYESTCRELKDVQNQLRQLMEELNTANKRAENSVSSDEVQKEVKTLKEALQKEKVLTKDLGMAAAKLQAMLKKTQALYTAEKKATSELKAKAGITDEQAEISSALTDSQVELQLLDAADEESDSWCVVEDDGDISSAEEANGKPAAAKPAETAGGTSV
ncbi:ribosome-binding protein 1-like isoform X6 [Asterias amurensis]|uniref:ribosome-binding protein 1-like isoform X6 n=1 Tax=Asterias amurensis TaxID=7602 RepID=UPI003AB38831